MGVLRRTWLGLAALGAGIVHLGVASTSPLAVLLPLALLGVAECAWGAVALARPRVPIPTTALVAALAGPTGWALALALGSAALPVAGMGGASVLDLLAAAVLAVHRRLPHGPETPAPPLVYVAGMIAGAAVVALITTVSLGASPIGAGAMAGMHM